MRRLVIVGALGLSLATGAAHAQTVPPPVVATPEPPPAATTEPPPAVDVRPTVDVDRLVARARDLVDDGDLDGALATANKAPEGEARDSVLAAIVAAQIAAGDVPEALTVAARIGDAETRTELVESLGRMLTEVGPATDDEPAAAPEVVATAPPPSAPDDSIAPTPVAPADRPALIAAVQERLIELGFSIGSVDGVAGRRTERAVRSFQNLAGIPADGEVTPELYEALDEAVVDQRYVRFGTEAALIGPPFSNALRGRLGQDDLVKAAEAISFALDEMAPGETVSWRNGSTEGEVVLEAHFASTDPPGQPCHRFAHTISVDGITETADRVTVCRDPVEGWRFVDRQAP